MKEIMVTRTVLTTKAMVLCLNTETAEPFNETINLPTTYKDNTKMMKAAANLIDNEEVKAVKITSFETEEIRYGMPLSEFMAGAKILPPLTKIAIGENE